MTEPYCYICERLGQALVAPYLCRACLAALPHLSAAKAPALTAWRAALAATIDRTVRVAFAYDGIVKEAIVKAKFAGQWHAFRALAPWLARRLSPLNLDAVTYVPLHPSRARRRGYDQAERLARLVACELNRPLLTDVLLRTRATRRQSETESRQERLQNVANAFRFVSESDLSGCRLALIDDVMTTGATLVAAGQALAQSRAHIVLSALASPSSTHHGHTGDHSRGHTAGWC